MNVICSYASTSSSDEDAQGLDHLQTNSSDQGGKRRKLVLQHSSASESPHSEEDHTDPSLITNPKRVRTFPHVTGNFATHVYTVVKVPLACQPALTALLGCVQQQLPDMQPVVGSKTSQTNRAPTSQTGLKAHVGSLIQEQYHISFSRTIPIRLEQSDALLAELKEQLRNTPPFRIHIHGTPRIFTNDSKTRTFLALSASSTPLPLPPPPPTKSTTSLGISTKNNGKAAEVSILNEDGLVAMAHAVSRAFHFNGLPKYYDNPQPHISLAWLIGDQEQELHKVLQQEKECVEKASQRIEEGDWSFELERVVCVIGQKECIVWKCPNKK